jgi:transposase-like protein
VWYIPGLWRKGKMGKKKHYTKEFKAQAAKLVLEQLSKWPLIVAILGLASCTIRTAAANMHVEITNGSLRPTKCSVA